MALNITRNHSQSGKCSLNGTCYRRNATTTATGLPLCHCAMCFVLPLKLLVFRFPSPTDFVCLLILKDGVKRAFSLTLLVVLFCLL